MNAGVTVGLLGRVSKIGDLLLVLQFVPLVTANAVPLCPFNSNLVTPIALDLEVASVDLKTD